MPLSHTQPSGSSTPTCTTHPHTSRYTDSLTTLTSDSLSGNWWTSWTKLYNGLFCGFKQWNLNKAPSNVVFFPICISSGRPPPTIKNLWPLRTKGNPQMRRNSRLHYAYLNCSVLPCGQIIDAFCLDVTKCGERLCNETNIENAPLTLVQHRCLDWHKAWTEISSGGKKELIDCYKQTAGKPKGKVAETNSMWTVKQEFNWRQRRTDW